MLTWKSPFCDFCPLDDQVLDEQNMQFEIPGPSLNPYSVISQLCDLQTAVYSPQDFLFPSLN